MNKTKEKIEITLTGFPASEGIAIGSAALIQIETVHAPHRIILKSDIEEEIAHLNSHIFKTETRLNTLLEQTENSEKKLLLETHILLLKNSRLTRYARNFISENLLSAESAIEKSSADIITQLSTLQDPYLASKQYDIQALSQYLLRTILNIPWQKLEDIKKSDILITENLSPLDAAFLDPDKISGIATSFGGSAGHSAVITRSLGIPAVLGIEALFENIHAQDTLIIDGCKGIVILNPTFQTLQKYRLEQGSYAQNQALLKKLISKDCLTQEGVKISLAVNLETLQDAERALKFGATNIGLLRTEFQFLSQNTPPTEEEQYHFLTQIQTTLKNCPLTIRVLDIGNDKLSHILKKDPAFNTKNPALGVRGIRFLLKHPHLLKTQLRALLRVAQNSLEQAPLRILIPMVTTADEMRQTRQILELCAQELEKEGYALSKIRPQLGCMIETPAAALAADDLATVSDFLALGTNDLTQYTVAVDRDNAQTSELYTPLHPSVLRLIDFTIQAAKRTKTLLSVCGEIASDPAFCALLLGMGVRNISVSPARLLPIKKHISELSLEGLTPITRQILSQSDLKYMHHLFTALQPKSTS